MLQHRTQIWHETLRNHPRGLVVNTAAILGATLIVGHTHSHWFWLWVVISLGVSAVRYGIYVYCCHFIKQHSAQAIPKHHIVLLHLSILSAAINWTIVAWIGIPEFQAKDKFAILIIISALAGGATGTLASLKITGKIYIALLIIPASLRMLLMDDPSLSVLAILGFIFAWVMMSSHQNNFRLLERSLHLARSNEDLISQLSVKNTEISNINSELEQTVEDRTKELQYLANHDLLTSLLNRRGLAEQSYQPKPVIHHQLFLFIDLDRFKHINDGLGHDWGDLLLQAVAHRLKELVDELAAECGACHHSVCRWGGDEFAVHFICETFSAKDVHPACHYLQVMLSQPYQINGRQLHIGASIGVFEKCGEKLTNIADAVSCADMAASEAKRLGRGRIVFYSEVLADIQRRRLALSIALTNVHKDGSLKLLFQPIVAAKSTEVVALEALLRWTCAEIGPVSPDEFIPLAEESDHIINIGKWVLQQACSAAKAWQDKNDDRIAPKVAVNTSIRQLIQASFANEVQAILKNTGLGADRLVIEVTESVFDEQNMQQALISLLALHEMGVEIHLDDFGTGYSSLSRLHEFPIDAIKIDKSFVMSADEKSLAVVEGALLIAKKFGLKVIAEGVESAQQREKLMTLGVDELQGYFFGKPTEIATLSLTEASASKLTNNA